ncbi:protein singles bar-like [Trichogramma pretiosum]|uniref:protein singles bar-like n=1 Tax=Trichogramma pretiosum TaxID=7493 RepID=UPI0006C983E4|nr:protein singles bar-like [Trichogramma pretiosum]
MPKKAGPIIKESTDEAYGVGGIPCCWCRCCTCIHLEFLKSVPGIIKTLEVVISFMVQGLLLKYGLRFHAQIGTAFEGALTTCSACFMTSLILLMCYMVSEKSYKLIQASYFEIMFGTIACFFCLSAASCLGFATKTFLLPLYVASAGLEVYPAMTTAYMLCGTLGAVYAIDCYFALRNLSKRTLI